MVQFYSTNHQAPVVGFINALLHGLAPDGGLYYPTEIPRFTVEQRQRLRREAKRLGDLTDPANSIALLREAAVAVLHHWASELFPDRDALRLFVENAQTFPTPIRSVGPIQVLELFHGPTLAFKDVAAAYLARLMDYVLQQQGERAIVLVATSGDTGGAIAAGFGGMDNIQVVILYPEGKVSQLQEAQLTRVADNVTPIAVQADFDSCQAMVKQAFTRLRLPDLRLTSANSINIARLVPQIIYYVYLYAALGRDDLEVVVPSGNFGNITAGLFARAMGVPLKALTAATNANTTVPHYLETGDYHPTTTLATLSTAMDISNPSNFSRVLELYKHEHADVVANLRAFSITDTDTVSTMQRVYDAYDYLLCPHTAVGWAAAERHGRPDCQQVVIATASPVKFAAEIGAAADIEVENATELEKLYRLPSRKTVIPDTWEALEAILKNLN